MQSPLGTDVVFFLLGLFSVIQFVRTLQTGRTWPLPFYGRYSEPFRYWTAVWMGALFALIMSFIALSALLEIVGKL
jgi:hypothetical protein